MVLISSLEQIEPSPFLRGTGPDNLMDTGDDVTLPQSAFGNLYFFAGREFDFESGLSYNRHRYWDPRTGRFLQEDSLPGSVFSPGEFNKYPYVRNNPLRYVDPNGQQSLAALIAAGIIGAVGFTVIVISLLESTRVERGRQGEIRRKQATVCSLEEQLELEEAFEENRENFLKSKKLEIITQVAGVAAFTPEDQAQALGVEAGAAIGRLMTGQREKK